MHCRTFFGKPTSFRHQCLYWSVSANEQPRHRVIAQHRGSGCHRLSAEQPRWLSTIGSAHQLSPAYVGHVLQQAYQLDLLVARDHNATDHFSEGHDLPVCGFPPAGTAPKSGVLPISHVYRRSVGPFNTLQFFWQMGNIMNPHNAVRIASVQLCQQFVRFVTDSGNFPKHAFGDDQLLLFRQGDQRFL